jgi:hypothetical protein
MAGGLSGPDAFVPLRDGQAGWAVRAAASGSSGPGSIRPSSIRSSDDRRKQTLINFMILLDNIWIAILILRDGDGIASHLFGLPRDPGGRGDVPTSRADRCHAPCTMG